MTARKTAAKKATKRRPTKKSATKKAASKQNGSPKEVAIKGELRYKLEALKLKLDARHNEVLVPIQAEANAKLTRDLERALRNDPAYSKISTEWNEALKLATEKTTPGDDYEVKSIDVSEGTMTFVPISR